MAKIKKTVLESKIQIVQNQSAILDDLNRHVGSSNASFLEHLGKMAKKKLGISTLAERAQLDRTFLYKMLSRKGNPELESLCAILKSLGLRLKIEEIS